MPSSLRPTDTDIATWIAGSQALQAALRNFISCCTAGCEKHNEEQFTQLRKQMGDLAISLHKRLSSLENCKLEERLKHLEAPTEETLKILEELRNAVSSMAHDANTTLETHRKDLDAMQAARSRTLQEGQNNLRQATEDVEKRAKALDEREHAISSREQTADAGFQERRKEIMAEVEERRQAFDTLLQQLHEQEVACLEATEKLCTERIRHAKELANTIQSEEFKTMSGIEARAQELQKKRMDETARQVQRYIDETEAARRAARANEQRSEELKNELEIQKQALESRVKSEVAAHKAELADEIDRLKVENAQLAHKRAEVDELRARLASLAGSVNTDEENLTAEMLSVKLRNLSEENRTLRAHLEACPKEAELEELKKTSAKYDELLDMCGKPEYQRLQNELSVAKSAEARLENEKESLEYVVEGLTTANKTLSEECGKLRDMLNRYHEDESARQESYEENKARLEAPEQFPVKQRKDDRPDLRKAIEEGESAWLNHIHHWMEESGFQYSMRLLKAFHTSLKIAEWAPFSVLAGVSGTGKSELPRLYAEYGGLNHMLVSVQPNWDSQESLLGFYNSLDNRFEAQPLLRFLVQANLPADKGGLKDTMSIVILDEMNLAHVELYFAEFLSKLEQRRGLLGKEVPELQISLTSNGLYSIPLHRNVLWVGTMNQDETTKALSDKVLDRSTSLYFPRPRTLVNRKQLSRKPAFANQLTQRDWEKWVETRSECLETECGKDLNGYRELVEKMNDALGTVGRGVGHRVWQSIFYYMANHPDVREILSSKERTGKLTENDRPKLRDRLDIAFQDQIVQKLMPKMRGIETRGHSLQGCLKPIQTLFHSEACLKPLKEDYDKAMELGQGQFLWLSADYLNQDSSQS